MLVVTESHIVFWLIVLLALAFWGAVWGLAGAFLSTPLTVCLVVMGKHVPALSFIGVMMADEPALPVDVSYYQRLLPLVAEDEQIAVLTASLEVALARLGAAVAEAAASRDRERRLELRVAELERRLSMDSTDSGTPSSPLASARSTSTTNRVWPRVCSRMRPASSPRPAARASCATASGSSGPTQTRRATGARAAP